MMNGDIAPLAECGRRQVWLPAPHKTHFGNASFNAGPQRKGMRIVLTTWWVQCLPQLVKSVSSKASKKNPCSCIRNIHITFNVKHTKFCNIILWTYPKSERHTLLYSNLNNHENFLTKNTWKPEKNSIWALMFMWNHLYLQKCFS